MPTGVYTRKPRPSAPSVVNDDGSVSIPLMARDGSVRAYAIVDADDAEWVSQRRWSLGNRGYALRSAARDGRMVHVLMHRQLLGLTTGDGLEGDHINRDRLDNRRANLRILPKGLNQQNMDGHSNARSRHRGVGWDTKRGRWRASIWLNKRALYLGFFEREEDAAEAARSARMRYYPYSTE